jgi:hypothetical protein
MKKKNQMDKDGLKDGLNDMVIENMMDDYALEVGYHRRDTYNNKTIVKLGNHYKEILKLIGEDPNGKDY